VTDMREMFYWASSFNQDLCPWGDIPTFPYDLAYSMFGRSGCTYTNNPDRTNKGPFCASDCIESESSSVIQSLSSSQSPSLSPLQSQSPSSSQSPSLSPSSSQSPSSSHSPSYNWDDDNWDDDNWDDDYWDDDNLYSSSKESQNENIANESHQQSVKATVLARASTSSTTSTATSSSSSSTTKEKPTLTICYYAGTKKCPTKPGTNTAVPCSCKK